MGLSVDQIKKRFKSPEKTLSIQKAIRHENRLRFHVESYIDNSDMSMACTDFLNWVEKLLPKDKFILFKRLFRLPSPILKTTGKIFKELERVFDGVNPVDDYQFDDAEPYQDWQSYRVTHLNGREFWRKKVWEAIKTSINSVMVVDMPEEQTSDLPEPYYYLMSIAYVIDYNYTDDAISFILFKHGEDKIAAFDDEFYRVFDLDENGNIKEDYYEAKHDLGYCPANFLWSEDLTQSHKDLKKSPLTPELGTIDKLLFKSISKDHLDLYGSYPIYSAYEEDCDFENGETSDYCDGGFLRNRQNNDAYRMSIGGTSLFPCPKCSTSNIAGAGTFIEVPMPDSKEDPDLRDPVSITTIDRDSLDYNTEEVQRMELDIFSSIVGTGGDIEQKQSINESQVAANFESRINVLNSLKGNIEKAMKFANDTVCRLRYGDRFIGSSISLGTQFYIYSVSDLYSIYNQAKEAGVSEAQLDAISDKIIETEYKNDARAMQRMKILKNVEPYRHYTRQELKDFNDKGLLDADLLQIKINFNSLVDRFERENINVIEFGMQQAFDQKIKTINETLLKYVREKRIDSSTEEV